ncbi:MAG TPA: isoprenylcysteine carboxylmethyltransferase family protein [Gemmatimonadaceae bacterium]|nr:isoprenylcysteine carboxylmethyltransferase family protein [Gemmatimonadaceae bacterium]
MRPLPFVWPYALIFWAVDLWAFLPEMKIVRRGLEGGKRAGSKDSGSMKVLLAGMGVASLVAYPIAFVKAWSFPGSWQLPLFAVGVLLMFLGSMLRRYCWRTLGEYFTGDVSVKPDQPIISSGPYRLVRHPSYTAGMMMYIGIGFALGSWFSLALLTITTIATYSYRVLVEERVLLDALGEPYDAYLKGRKRFIPYIV